MHKCYMDNSCDTDISVDRFIYSSEIALLGSASSLVVNNTVFDNIYGDVGINILSNGKISLYNNSIKNCYFNNGFIKIDEKNSLFGNYIMDNIYFNNIRSNCGSVIHVDSLQKTTKTTVNITNSVFESNVAEKYGGVIYSISPYANKIFSLVNCTFYNNNALLGKIVYSYDLKSEPNITNIEVLKSIKGNFATNPTKLILNNELDEEISIYSGEMLPEGISGNINIYNLTTTQ
ncbi:hypothetical protein BCR36DRAFT_348666 [Piromyces finnis]|uniref:Right handed beta helix domain-containing protein n=1 Tax=Piromyces finnis TaxID=1754191 RepID=A0A1Y1VEZ9_9FUNG|nr:hypothetical protein BCR36DRAFT_348666 [Piromyces finnis]|eukprot:ORX53772.1 hypothetical protein BCR36DRAFT_348666 [Piromyces finnis]